MYWIKGGAAALAMLFVIGLAAGCDAHRLPTTVPNNVAALEASPLGKVLAGYGYTPAVILYDNKSGKISGYVWIACGTNKNLSDCSSNLNNEGTMTHPNIYVENGLVTTLEGPHDSKIDDRSYFVEVPTAYQHFLALSRHQQLALLGVMPAVAKIIGAPMEATPTVVTLRGIGEATVLVSH